MKEELKVSSWILYIADWRCALLQVFFKLLFSLILLAIVNRRVYLYGLCEYLNTNI